MMTFNLSKCCCDGCIFDLGDRFSSKWTGKDTYSCVLKEEIKIKEEFEINAVVWHFSLKCFFYNDTSYHQSLACSCRCFQWNYLYMYIHVLLYTPYFPGVRMVPISWCEMQCPKTLTKEHRKVARVQEEYLDTKR